MEVGTQTKRRDFITEKENTKKETTVILKFSRGKAHLEYI